MTTNSGMPASFDARVTIFDEVDDADDRASYEGVDYWLIARPGEKTVEDLDTLLSLEPGTTASEFKN